MPGNLLENIVSLMDLFVLSLNIWAVDDVMVSTDPEL